MSAFLDTNILVYAQQTGTKATISQSLIDQGGTISVQVLNELVAHHSDYDSLDVTG